jgi:hypothetical protein
MKKLIAWKEKVWDKIYPHLMELISLIIACAASVSFLQGNTDEAMYGMLASIFGMLLVIKTK